MKVIKLKEVKMKRVVDPSGQEAIQIIKVFTFIDVESIKLFSPTPIPSETGLTDDKGAPVMSEGTTLGTPAGNITVDVPLEEVMRIILEEAVDIKKIVKDYKEVRESAKEEFWKNGGK